MRLRSLLVFVSLLALPFVAQAERMGVQRIGVLNAELIRLRTAVGIHDRGAADVARFFVAQGATVRRAHVKDVPNGRKARIDLRRMGRMDLVAISATMRQSRQTVGELVDYLTRHGIPANRIVIGGRAIQRAHADALGVRWAAGPGPVLARIMRQAAAAAKR